jgi:hypothetical protein
LVWSIDDVSGGKGVSQKFITGRLIADYGVVDGCKAFSGLIFGFSLEYRNLTSGINRLN